MVWHGEFDRLFSQYYPHTWYLVPTFYAPSERWQVFKDSAKVRFSCGVSCFILSLSLCLSLSLSVSVSLSLSLSFPLQLH